MSMQTGGINMYITNIMIFRDIVLYEDFYLFKLSLSEYHAKT